METAAPGTIDATCFIVIGYGAGHGGRNDFAGIFCANLYITTSGEIPIHSGFGISHDVVIRHRRTDTGAAGDTKAAGQIDIQRVVFRRNRGILAGNNRCISNARLRIVVDAVHTYSGINSNRLGHASGSGNSNICSFRGGVYSRILSARHRSTIIDVGFRVILLAHCQSCAAQACLCRFGHRPALVIPKILAIFQNSFCIWAHEKIGSIFTKEVRYISCKIHGGDICIRFDLHIAGIYLRRLGLLVIFLSDVRFRAIIIIHHRNGSRAGSILRHTGSLGPAIHQV